MNKKLITVAVAAGLALPMVSAQAAEVADKKLEVYGKLHANFGSFNELGSTNDNWRLQSYASRLGFKGKQKLDDSFSATYKFEWQVDLTENKSTVLEGRNMYAGLKGGFGEIRIGRHDSPLKMAQGKFDQFGDTDGDLKNAGDQDGENRNNNTITYLGKFGDFGFNAQIIPGEGDGQTTSSGGTGKGDGAADATSVAISYKTGPLYLALAQDSYDGTDNQDEKSLTRVVATYKFSKMQLGAFFQTGVEKAQAKSEKEDWAGLSFNMKMGKNNKLKAQYITVEDNASSALKGTQTSIGFDHKIGKKGTVYVMYNTLEEKNTAVTKDNSSFSVGYIVKF